MGKPYVEGLAIHDSPKSYTVTRKDAGEALTGAPTGWVLSREKSLRGADAAKNVGSRNGKLRHGEVYAGPTRSETPGTFKTYGPPRLQEDFTTWSDQSTPTYPVSGQCPGQDGDPRVLVLINFTASSAIFLTRFPERRSTVRPSRFHHPQTSPAARQVSASGRSRALRHRRGLHLELLPTAQHRADDPRQLGGERHHHGVHVCSRQ